MRKFMMVATLALSVCGYASFAANDGDVQEPARPAPQDREVEKKNILEMLNADGRFRILLSVIKGSDLENTLASNDAFTFFAPMDEAFERVPKLAELLKNHSRLISVMNHHLIVGKMYTTENVCKEPTLLPKEGNELKIKCGEKNIEVDDAKILIPNFCTKMAAAHGIDHVLMEDNESFLRMAGTKMESGLKKGAEKVKEVFNADKKESTEHKEGTPEK